MMQTESDAWNHTVNMYAKWANLNSEGAMRMKQFHRDRSPTMRKVFDQIDAEAEGKLMEN